MLSSGCFTCFVGCRYYSKDQEQKAAEADVKHFSEDLGPFVVAADTTRMPMVFTDAKKPNNPIIFANDAFIKLTGYDRDEVAGAKLQLPAREPDRPPCPGRDRGRVRGKGLRRISGTGARTAAPSAPRSSSIRSGTKPARLYEHFVSLVDTTRHEQARSTPPMLIDELNHRVKNTLATVQSIVVQAVRNSSDPQIVRESIETRIAALSRSHDLLGREKWEGAGLHDLVVQCSRRSASTEGRAERFTIEGDNVRLSPKAALALGIALNELATNAVKYGAFSNEAGTISIAVGARDNGPMAAGCPSTGGKGRADVTPPRARDSDLGVLEQGLPHELGGKVELDYPPDGIVCIIDIPRH